VVDCLPPDWAAAQRRSAEGPWGAFNGGRWAADVAVHPSGRWLVVANRLHDSIAAFEVHPDPSRRRGGPVLTCLGHTPCGSTPRSLQWSPDGQVLAAALQHGHAVASFTLLDSETAAHSAPRALLAPADLFADAPCASCVRFL
jgi:6-phosphogluconolactonase